MNATSGIDSTLTGLIYGVRTPKVARPGLRNLGLYDFIPLG